MPQVAHPTPQNIKKPSKTKGFLMFFEMQPMQQVTKKCSQNRPKGSKNRAQDAQNAAKMASWSPHGRQEASQTTPQHKKAIAFYSFLQVCWTKCYQVPPRTSLFEPTSLKTASKMHQVAHPTPQNIKKPLKTNCFFYVF